jgi:hypothetical protein
MKEIVAAYQMLLDQDESYECLAEALRLRGHVILSRATYDYLWSNQLATNGPTETTKAKARSRKSHAAKDKAKGETKTKRGKE